ncbi:MAG: hypothetical protein JWN56_293 [Sphingobacteriales bacterium]|nr:hypothetical protein [Sphingobacteriales bacterium]
MKKLKYQGGLTKLLCQQRASWYKKQFFKNILSHKSAYSPNSTNIDFEIISFSGSASFEDQLLSIYSFVFYAGEPIKWTIYSDKTYTDVQKEIILKKFLFVTIVDWDVYDYFRDNKFLNDYATVSALAKKINIILGHSYKHQTVYVDSDIVFYKNIRNYLTANVLNKGLWYVPDTLGDVENYFSTERESIYPLNSGLLILNSDFDSADIFTYLQSLKGNYGYFSEQSSFEFAFRKQGANLLDPRQFIIDTEDQFDFEVKYDPETIAMRHYTGPVRHKMWQNGWKWHFKSMNTQVQ